MSVRRAEVHPFDVTTLEKGVWIPADKCEEVIGIKRDNRRYSIRLLALKEDLEQQWEEYRDEVITVVCEKDGLRICTDDEAVEVNRDRRVARVRGLGRDLVRQQGVDTTKLSKKARITHERELIVGAAFLLGGRREQQAQLKAHKRSTPKQLK